MDAFKQQLEKLSTQNQYRSIPDLVHQGRYITRENRKMLNMSSNDYLGLASNENLRQSFLQQYGDNFPPFTSSSSRLLTGNFPVYTDLEQLIAQCFQRESALLFNSGYHANLGILPALTTTKSLILADKLVHASMIDGIRLSQCEFFRYRHNDYEHLKSLLEKNAGKFDRTFIVTESVFSMDGDVADLKYLAQLKKQFPNTYLYVDEAHAIGVYGKNGLGIAERANVIADIDLLVGTFGKALASMGAYVVCDQILKECLINQMRPLIFSTALPPFNVAWTHFIFERLLQFSKERTHLEQLSAFLRQEVEHRTQIMPSQTCIVPYILGENEKTLAKAKDLQEQGYYCLPIRPPTVPKGTSRIRLSLTVDMTMDEVKQFVACL
ncbi:8-amino-7-oxononanoate synthase [Haemophilus quentini]|uniref:8-amino-7-ketopelargonate synthase n=1 Tax=Haemophilus quentini TaxID=123834 RepID=A0ABX3BTP1_9PAST|nr:MULTISPECIES: 8-amino-7-oxononanoate synthase [Haemophilus]EGT81129.1 Putative 8-amino-7-oxononanoate synthase/2-amino-3-ketobutyrate coenzyme A ligase [Haemophilus haemolyticus M21639]NYA48546.1 8-amino-7-oxononanoate synthase [Haemophilus haemolyticus]OEY76138.1 8-amino-7-oxononanoate synthase [Haemophilus quentini]OEY76628.1 8-amino-7-oxononanoate synthase [Haemophilus quentini]ORC34564.1 8-amino-7-oxononanoate synthase [Haemophilus quentini]